MNDQTTIHYIDMIADDESIITIRKCEDAKIAIGVSIKNEGDIETLMNYETFVKFKDIIIQTFQSISDRPMGQRG